MHSGARLSARRDGVGFARIGIVIEEGRRHLRATGVVYTSKNDSLHCLPVSIKLRLAEGRPLLPSDLIDFFLKR
jgi:hypothetical protein